ncbi:MAG: hypothetical protein IKV96_04795 [Firmicutes bacterium]|nr:hypothetical protein [Bacillota bacterium]
MFYINSNYILGLLEARITFLNKVRKEKELSMQSFPNGSLNICKNHSGYQYYHRIDANHLRGNYIPNGNKELACSLAQKDYDQKVLRAVEQELKSIRRFLKGYPKVKVEKVYETLHPERQKMVIPVVEIDEQFVARWEAEEYQGKPFYDGMPELFTAKGERVRSKSEIIIADTLAKAGIPYRYEYPIEINESGVKAGWQITKDYHPDFTVLNLHSRKEMYWEHFGMMDDPEYMERTLKKLHIYEQNGIFIGRNLIATFESRQSPINSQKVMTLINEYLK